MMTHEAESEVNAIGVKEMNGCCWTFFVLLCICCLNLFIAHRPWEIWGCDCKKYLYGSEFSFISVNVQGIKERKDTRDFSYFLKLLCFLGNNLILAQ